MLVFVQMCQSFVTDDRDAGVVAGHKAHPLGSVGMYVTVPAVAENAFKELSNNILRDHGEASAAGWRGEFAAIARLADMARTLQRASVPH